MGVLHNIHQMIFLHPPLRKVQHEYDVKKLKQNEHIYPYFKVRVLRATYVSANIYSRKELS